MDIRMPLMDGLEDTRRIKATEKGARTPVVALTASAFEEQRGNILAAGCDDFVRKPFRDEDIWMIMEKHLGVRFLRDEPPSPHPALFSPPLSSAALDHLDRDLLFALSRAALTCERETCLSLIGGIPPEQAPAAQALKGYVTQHKFDKLYGMLEDYLSNPRAGNDAGST
jgi:CheY-like chemotaxis protein